MHRQSFNLPLNRLNRRGPMGAWGIKMIRTIWLATICLAVLSTLAVGKAVMTRTSSSATERPTELTTISTGLTQDTLGKADRLEITTYVRQEVSATSALQPTEPVVPT